jgi:SAM-dependent methyltransferase
MHPSVMRWTARQVEARGLERMSVLEVGSLDVNGSVRSLFHGDYIGVDMRPGVGVDRLVNAHDLGTLDERFDLVVSTEMLEHDDAPWISVAAMRAVCRDGGWLLLTCRGYDERGCFPEHDFPGDHWRFSVSGVRALLERCGWRPVLVEGDPECPGVLALARA